MPKTHDFKMLLGGSMPFSSWVLLGKMSLSNYSIVMAFGVIYINKSCSDNGLSPAQCKAITWITADFKFIRPLTENVAMTFIHDGIAFEKL